MPVNELVELNQQIALLQSKGFIHPSSPLGSTRVVHGKEICDTMDVRGLWVVE
jgi:hypothetical protein